MMTKVLRNIGSTMELRKMSNSRVFFGKSLLLLAAVNLVGSAFAEDVVPAAASPAPAVSLDDQLQSLSLPSNQPPASVSQEKLYAVQNRYSSLKWKSEFTFGGAKNFNADSFITATQLDLAYRIHLSDRFNLGLYGSKGYTSLSSAGERLMTESILPDTAYVKYRANMMVGFNAFYGKIRFSMDHVVYFDQYIALGGGRVFLDTIPATAISGDVGFVFWLGKSGSIRMGLRDDFYNQQRRLASSQVHDLLGHVDVGVLFGGS